VQQLNKISYDAACWPRIAESIYETVSRKVAAIMIRKSVKKNTKTIGMKPCSQHCVSYPACAGSIIALALRRTMSSERHLDRCFQLRARQFKREFV
jgi:pyrimidine deaminase RibD-like protein